VVFLADHGNNMGAKEMWKTESWIEKTREDYRIFSFLVDL
jgi:hypothetical protein